MKAIQVVLNQKLLHSIDQAARQLKQSRSAFIRDAIWEHVQRLETHSLEERDRQGYLKLPQAQPESKLWESEAAWPSE